MRQPGPERRRLRRRPARALRRRRPVGGANADRAARAAGLRAGAADAGRGGGGRGRHPGDDAAALAHRARLGGGPGGARHLALPRGEQPLHRPAAAPAHAAARTRCPRSPTRRRARSAGWRNATGPRRSRRAIAALPERQRLALVLRHFEERANPEIAAILEVSVEAVESLLARGRRDARGAAAAARAELGYGDGQVRRRIAMTSRRSRRRGGARALLRRRPRRGPEPPLRCSRTPSSPTPPRSLPPGGRRRRRRPPARPRRVPRLPRADRRLARPRRPRRLRRRRLLGRDRRRPHRRRRHVWASAARGERRGDDRPGRSLLRPRLGGELTMPANADGGRGSSGRSSPRSG